MMTVKMTYGYCNWINEISARYPLELVEYSNCDGDQYIAKLDSSRGMIIIGGFNSKLDRGKTFDRREAKRA